MSQEEIDAMLLHLTLECARPSWRFKALFNAQERQMLGFAINTFMGVRQHNRVVRGGPYGPLSAGQPNPPQGEACSPTQSSG